jgi:hypothetical protein
MTDDQLRSAHARVRRLRQAGRLRSALATQIGEVDQLLVTLERQHAAEQRDVTRLQGRTLTAIVSGVLGNKDAKLAKETAEAEASGLRLEGHRARRRQLVADLTALNRELDELADAPRSYERELARAERDLSEAGDRRGVELSDRLAETAADLREHDEAYRAGRTALDGVQAVLRELSGAGNWSTVDMFTGSGADFVEHAKLERASQAAWHAQQALDRFSRELADVGAHVSPQLPEIDTRWFADWFFDNIITDAIRHSRITRTYEQVAEIARWVQTSVDQLGRECGELSHRRAALTAERERLHGLT